MGSSVFPISRNTIDLRALSCSLLLLVLHINLVFATSRTSFPPNHPSATLDDQPLTSQSPIQQNSQAEELGRLGSIPPSCERKCYGCSPCEAIQVPTTSTRHRRSHALRLDYADYKPEGWKCKCGPSLYSP
ncbi:EPIDERMAL PATTERNING FACTOR-like protein 3 [Linum grandiflorum]